MSDTIDPAKAAQEALAAYLKPDPTGGRAGALLDRIARHDPVPCAGCTACCRNDTAVALRGAWGDDLAAYPPETLAVEFVRAAGGWSVALRRQENGDCIFLGPAGCTIYDRRPAVCRAYDCRRALLRLSDAEQAELVEKGVHTAEEVAAAQARVLTLRLLPEEQELWGTDKHKAWFRKRMALDQ